ncbi:MAG: hypothetical protein HYY45_13325 [Deltaproteobacteria bacterium]|nr:hypothetical protein [Deltaproteobacteria bacterium]
MPCPFLKEIVMAYCRAYPVKKPVPRSQIMTASPCMGEGYRECGFYKEIVAQIEGATDQEPKGFRRESRKEVA